MTDSEATKILLAKLGDYLAMGFPFGESVRIMASDYGLDEQKVFDLLRKERLHDTARTQEGS